MLDVLQTVAGSCRRPVPCTVSSRANTAQISTAVVTVRGNVEPDVASGETKSVITALQARTRTHAHTHTHTHLTAILLTYLSRIVVIL